MGRKRTRDRHLPERVYLRSGTYWFVDHNGGWHKMGRDYASMLANLSALSTFRQDLSTMGRILDRYEMEVLPTKAYKTRRDQQPQIARLRKVFGHMTPDAILPKHIYAYCDKRPPTARLRERELLSHAFTKAIEWGAATSNPCALVRLKRPKRRTRYITDTEYAAFRDLAPPVVQVLMDLALLTGQRLGDLLNIRLDDLTDEGIRFEQSKTGKRLIVLWTAELEAVVSDAKKLRRRITGLYLINNRNGQPYTTQSFKNLWQRCMKKWPGERFTFHDLRAKSASDAESDMEAQARLGHASVEITRRVYRRAPTRVRALDIGRK